MRRPDTHPGIRNRADPRGVLLCCGLILLAAGLLGFLALAHLNALVTAVAMIMNSGFT